MHGAHVLPPLIPPAHSSHVFFSFLKPSPSRLRMAPGKLPHLIDALWKNVASESFGCELVCFDVGLFLTFSCFTAKPSKSRFAGCQALYFVFIHDTLVSRVSLFIYLTTMTVCIRVVTHVLKLQEDKQFSTLVDDALSVCRFLKRSCICAAERVRHFPVCRDHVCLSSVFPRGFCFAVKQQTANSTNHLWT